METNVVSAWLECFLGHIVFLQKHMHNPTLQTVTLIFFTLQTCKKIKKHGDCTFLQV